jgi:hypothetical protein
MEKRFILGISGVAGCGKDTLALILQKTLSQFKIKSSIFSLATQLKHDVKDECLSRFSIDPTNCTRTEKEKIRDFLVEYGELKRKESKGTYWINKVQEKIDQVDSNIEIIIIPDIRFKEYEYDETDFVKNSGVLIHLSRKDSEGNIYPPANDAEAKNDPILQEQAEYKIFLFNMLNNNNIDEIIHNNSECASLVFFILSEF